MTDATLARQIAPAEQRGHSVLENVERVIRAADAAVVHEVEALEAVQLPYWVNPTIWEYPAALPEALIRPRSVMRSIVGTEWPAALAILGGAALVRSVMFLLFGIGSDMTNAQIAIGTLTSLVGPFVFVAVVAGLLLAIGATLRNARPLRALSLAIVASAPVVVRTLLQAVATPIVQQALQPAGLIGYLAPKAPALWLHALAPVDAFGLWSLGLVVLAGWITVSSALKEQVAG